MKKIISLLMAMVMVFSLATVAAADEGDDTTTTTGTADTYGPDGSKVENPTSNNPNTYGDIKTVKIYKKYQLGTSVGVSPAETFSFTAANGWDADKDGVGATIYVENPGVGVTNDDSIPEITVTTNPEYAQGDATADGAVKEIVITLPDNYANVGVYHYTLTEDDAGVAGVTYNDDRLHVVVTVIQQGDPTETTTNRVRVAAVHVETAETKEDIIVNTYEAGSLSINKQVTGNLGDKSQYFEVTVNFESPDPVNAPIYYYGGSYSSGEGDVAGYGSSNAKGTAVEVNGFKKAENEDVYKATATIMLKDNDTVTFDNIPYGVTYTVTESDYTESATDTDKKLGYDKPSITVDEGTASTGFTTSALLGYTTTGEGDAAVTNENESDAVVITNNKETEVDTGISLDSAPYFLMLAVAVIGMVALVSKKRHEV